jgi:lipid-A-disaccharide synthase
LNLKNAVLMERAGAATNPNAKILVCVSAGEASGDAYAARLIQAIQDEWCEIPGLPALEFGGLAGTRTQKLGVNLIQNTSQWGAMGITQAARIFLRVLGSLLRAKRFLSGNPPGLFVPIDFGYANIKLARHAKKTGWKVLYFVPPGSWRRDRQGRDLPYVTDAIATPFDWSERILKHAGCNVFWFGHPIKQLIAEERQIVANKCLRSETLLAILPGSRDHELEANLPLIAKAIEGIDCPLEFVLAPSFNPAVFKQAWKRLSSREATFTIGQAANVLLRARAAIVCSGTATLEAALCGCPMVVIYELPKILKAEMKIRYFQRPKFISLPNIMLDRKAVPEYVEMNGIPPEVVRQQLQLLLPDGEAREAQLEAFEELDQLLGPDDAIDRTARLAMSMLREIASGTHVH